MSETVEYEPSSIYGATVYELYCLLSFVCMWMHINMYTQACTSLYVCVLKYWLDMRILASDCCCTVRAHSVGERLAASAHSCDAAQ